MNLVVFTDLDGTLLDGGTYSFRPAVPALGLLRRRGIPLVLCSSKTREEILHWRRRLRNREPYISENGGGIFFPMETDWVVPSMLPARVEEKPWGWLMRLGARYTELREAMEALREDGFAVRGFGDMDAAEVSRLTGLPARQAEMAKMRDFDEPFVFRGGQEEMAALVEAIRGRGLRVTRGRFYHLMGESDKGRAVSILTGVYRSAWGEIRTAALGDGLNDLPMLEVVDVPMLVQQADGRHHPRIHTPGLVRLEGVGPEGWNRGILKVLGAQGT